MHGLNDKHNGAALHALLQRSDLSAADLPAVLHLLEAAGSQAYAVERMNAFYAAGLAALRETLGDRAEASLLWATAQWLMERKT